MWLPDDTKISGRNTVGQWKVLKPRLSSFNDHNSWKEAYQEFFWKRISSRYLRPIKVILDRETYLGEGFSVMTIQCALIEFLESTYQGLKYRFLKKGEHLNLYEYNTSQKLFESFLLNEEPFRNHFNQDLATEFYKNIRCGLIHEAATKGTWKIKGKHQTKIIEKTQTETVVYRTNFQVALKEFLNNYKAELLQSKDRKEAFIRKIDSLCKP